MYFVITQYRYLSTVNASVGIISTMCQMLVYNEVCEAVRFYLHEKLQ